MTERLGVLLFRTLLTVLPAGMRRAWGEELVLHFRARQRQVRRRWTVAGLPLFWVAEAAGLIRAAWRARRPDEWTRRTAPGGRYSASPEPTHEPPTAATYMDQLAHDLRFAFRSFRRRPGLTVLAVASLALGIGASTAMFSVVDSVLLEPLPYDDPDELVHVWASNPQWADHPTLSGAALRGIFSEPEFHWLAERQRVFEHVGAFYAWGGTTLSGDEGRPERLALVRATGGLLPALGVKPLRGRIFQEEDDPRDGARSVLLTERFWRERFGADPGVVGTDVRLDDEPWTVIGILPASAGVATREDADAWTLVAGSSTDGNWGNHSVSRVIGRLGDGVTAEQARAEVERLLAEVPDDSRHGHGASVFPAAEDMTRRVRAPLLVLIAGAFVLLAVGCGNVAALLLGAGIDREREIAVRGALGAGRGRLARQLLTESLLLAGAGALGGVALAAGLHGVLLELAPANVPRIAEATLDGRVLAFAVAVSVLGGVLFGMVPALGLSRPDLGATIQSSRGSTSGRSRLQAAVVVGELALATVLLVSATLLGRTLAALNNVEVGLDGEGLYAMRTALPTQRFEDDDPDSAQAAVDAYFAEVTAAVASTPGVEAVAVTSHVPLTGDRSNNNVNPEGWDGEAEGEDLVAERRFVSGRYFDVTGIEIVEGRAFEPPDNRSDAAPVIILSEGLARRVWPNGSALGKQVSFWGRDPATVVGVAADLRDESLARETVYAFYVPFRQVQAQYGSVLFRVAGDPATVLPAVRERVWSVDPDLPVTSMTSFDDILDEAVAEQRYRARLMVVFAAMAALFALMGVYGVVARSVAGRTRELGIRAALGARRVNIHSLVLVQGFRLALFGTVLGVGASLWATRFLDGLLFGVEPVDPVTLVGIAALVGAASLAASLPPSRRATRVEPTEALRAD